MRIVYMPRKKRSSLGASSAKEKSHLRAEMLSTATASEKKLKEEMLSPTSTYQSGLVFLAIHRLEWKIQVCYREG